MDISGAKRSSSSIICNVALSKKLSDKLHCPAENVQVNLIAVVDDNILVWSREDCCFYSQQLQHDDAPVQTLYVTRPPIWTVQKISVNKGGTGVLLVGRRGVGVVDLPQRWGKNHTFDGGREHITCRIEYLAERFLVCQQKVCVVAAQWHPGSPHQNHVIMLATDHYLRVYSLRSRDVPDQALCVSAARPGTVFSNKIGASALGEEPVDFTIAAPYIPKPSKDTDVAEASPIPDSELFWPTFVLYANGDVFHTTLSLHHHKLRSRTVVGPLLMLPARQDNYGLEWCTIGWLGQSASIEGVGSVLVLGTTGGSMHHCVVMPPKPKDYSTDTANKEDVVAKKEQEDALEKSLASLSVSAAPVSLFVYESIDLEVSLVAEEEFMLQPLMIYADQSTPNRYFVIHSTGLHAITVTLVDALRYLSSSGDHSSLLSNVMEEDSECRVEHLVCTRALPSAPALPIFGASLWCSHSSHHELLVLLSSGSVVTVKLPVAALPILPKPPSASGALVKKEAGSSDESQQSFESVINEILQRKCSQPLLISSTSEALRPTEALDLTNKTLHTLRTEYIAPQASAQQHIMHRIKVLCDQQRALCGQINTLQSQRVQLLKQNESLQQKQLEAKKRQDDINERLDAIVATALRGVPGLSGGERWFLKELQSIQEQLPHLNSDVQHLHTKLNWHTSNLQNNKSEDEKSVLTDAVLSQNQLISLKKSIGAETDKINGLMSRFNAIKKNMEV